MLSESFYINICVKIQQMVPCSDWLDTFLIKDRKTLIMTNYVLTKNALSKHSKNIPTCAVRKIYCCCSYFNVKSPQPSFSQLNHLLIGVRFQRRQTQTLKSPSRTKTLSSPWESLCDVSSSDSIALAI